MKLSGIIRGLKDQWSCRVLAEGKPRGRRGPQDAGQSSSGKWSQEKRR